MSGAEFVDDRVPSVMGRDESDQVTPDEQRGEWSEDLTDRFFADEFLRLPGMGESGPGCGDHRPTAFCGSCATIHFGQTKCGRRECPSCWFGEWVVSATETIVTTLATARAAESGDGRRLLHVASSPSEGSIRSLSQYRGDPESNTPDGMIADGYRLAQDNGVRGGVAAGHGHRLTNDAKREFWEDRKAGRWDGGKWAWVRQHDADWRELVKWSPHTHVIGLARDLAENKPDEQDGWVCERLDSFGRFEVDDDEAYEEMVNRVAYVLTHTPVEIDCNRSAYRYFGTLAPGASEDYEGELNRQTVDEVEERVVAAVERELLGREPDEDGVGECPTDGCRGSLRPMSEAFLALRDDRFVEDIGHEREHRLRTAMEWFNMDVMPPPGMQRPQSETQAREAFEALV